MGGKEDEVVPADPPTLLMSPDEVAKTLSVATRTLRAIRSCGGLPKPVKLPGRVRMVRWRRADIEDWVSKLGTADR
jgi:predicted DNA-binding transcriptional regulator AlpA